MSNLKTANKLRNALLLIALCTSGLVACTLLLPEEQLTCATNADCAKFPGTICDLQALECRAGKVVDAGNDASDAGGDTYVPPDAPYSGDPCANPNKPLVELKGDIDTNLTLKCDSDYLLIGRVAVKPNYTATIAAGTTIYADTRIDPVTNSLGTLVIPPGARIVATGTADSPVVFTSAKRKDPVKFASNDAGVGAGDWGGIFVFGEAPVNTPTGTGNKASLAPWGGYGGTKPNNDSGRLEFVRIEYAGAKLPDGSDGASIALDGVGDQTVVDHVQVRFSLNDCYEVLGGKVNLKHVLCQYPNDDGIAWDNGWTGKVQFVVIQARPNIDDGSNGLQGRSGAPPAVPISEPTIYNATFCGANRLPEPNSTQQFAARIEKYSHVHLVNSLMMGFQAAFDLRGTSVAADVAGDGGVSFLEIKNSLAFGNISANVAFDETSPTPPPDTNAFYDDDNGFDEVAWFHQPANQNSENDPGIAKCFDPASPQFAPSAPIGTVPGGAGSPHAAAPPNDGFFDQTAVYLGAFKDQSDLWATGKWVVWSDK